MVPSSRDPIDASLARKIGRAGFFALSFGSIVGSGWVVILGDWLGAAGPGGAAIAFFAGGLIMMIIAGALSELASRFPRAGGEFIYILEGLGQKPAFLVGWLLTLSFVAFTAFEGIALAWFIQTLLPRLRGDIVYTLLGQDIRVSALVLGVGAAALFTGLNYLGSGIAVLFQRVVTFAFIACAIGLVTTGFVLGDPVNIEPLFAGSAGHSWAVGAFWVFATSMVFLNGFQSAIYAVEERAPAVSVEGVSKAMIAGVAGAVLFYCLLIFSASSAMPWKSLLGQELPSAAAFGALTKNGLLRTVVLVAAAISLLKTWNALHLGAARLILAQARLGYLPPGLAKVHPRYGTPSNAVLFVGTCTLFGILLGRGAIVPIVNMSAVATTTTFFLCLVVLLKLRRESTVPASFRVPGGILVILFALAGALIAAAVALFEPMWSAGRIPLEWYLLIGWALIGIGLRAARNWGERLAVSDT